MPSVDGEWRGSEQLCVVCGLIRKSSPIPLWVWRRGKLCVCVIYTYTYIPLTDEPVKNLPAKRETWVLFLGREDPLEKEMAIHSSTLAQKIPWKEEPDRLQSMGSQRVRHN